MPDFFCLKRTNLSIIKVSRAERAPKLYIEEHWRYFGQWPVALEKKIVDLNHAIGIWVKRSFNAMLNDGNSFP